MALYNLISARVAILGFLVAGVVYYYAKHFLRFYRVRHLGGRPPLAKSKLPFGLDLPRRAIEAARAHQSPQLWLDLLDECGALKQNNYTCEFYVLGQPVIFTADPDNIKAFLATQFNDYGKGQKFHEEWQEFLGDSIFNTDGQQWQHSRALIRPMFMRERVADLDVIEEHISKLIRHLGDGRGDMVRFDKLLSRYSLDTATHFLFGRSANSLDDEEARFGQAFDEVQRVQSLMSRAGPLRHFISKKTFHEGLRTMDEFMEPLIQETLAMSPEELESKLSKSDTFLHALARTTRDRTMIRDQLVSLLLAGRDTTSATLSWLFIELARNPKVVEKLLAEIHQFVGTGGEKPTYQHIKDMKYLTAIINETLRLYPAVPFNVRTSLKASTLPYGAGPDGRSKVALPEGASVGYSTLLMQRRRDLYPPISDSFPYDPLDWVPERWATWTPKNWQFVPFNGGPRICIGQQFAMVNMGYTIIRIFQEFSRLVDYGNPIVLKTDILLTPGEGVKIGFVNNSRVSEKA